MLIPSVVPNALLKEVRRWDIYATILVYLVDHLNGIRETDDIHPCLFDFCCNALNGRILQAFMDHCVS